ncbi:hypothetical protein [Bacillus alkalicellulosilyticus]|uniref:hypothetical protein n=1 Tax=Alkalihalobacterium alkalicellulosilyticum TaxID=1912214 RepID=UPI0009963891|nr:hypothetical protein [Bacillus alkalicellulosilyticus]
MVISIRSIKALSACKVGIYLSIILSGVALFGAYVDPSEVRNFSNVLPVLLTFPIFFGLSGCIGALCYNLCSTRFGRLEVKVNETTNRGEDSMKNIEITEVKIISAFKSVIYFSIIPSFFYILGGLVVLIGGIIGAFPIVAGIPLLFIGIFFSLITGLIGMLVAFIYNTLSKFFGGLKVQIISNETSEDEKNQYVING